MHLIVWRHAEAEDLAPGGNDVDRALTARGRRQAKRMGRWLDNVMPEGTRVFCSPARRAVQTADLGGCKFELHPALTPGSTVEQLIELVQWPLSKHGLLVVGHQPVLGQTVARLLGMQAGECTIKKGAIWWLQHRLERTGAAQVQVVAVISPDLL